MQSVGKRIKELRLKWEFTQEDMAEKLGMNRANFSNYERSVAVPPGDILVKIADILHTTTDYLLGRENNDNSSTRLPELTAKDERDVARDLEKILSNLDSRNGMAFYDGEPMDEESAELLRISLENSMRLAKQMAKQKFTPKKYRK